jgi:hypothetical protein
VDQRRVARGSGPPVSSAAGTRSYRPAPLRHLQEVGHPAASLGSLGAVAVPWLDPLQRQLEADLDRLAELDRRIREACGPSGSAVMRREPGHLLCKYPLTPAGRRCRATDQQRPALAQRRSVTGPGRLAVVGG